MPDPNLFADSPESVGVDSERLEALFARVEKEVREGLLPSAQVAVARQGRIAGMRTFGSVRHEGRPAAATDETLYVVFSATKAITSAAGWLLIQEGKLDPSEPVAAIVPEFGTHGKEVVTVEQLFTHTAGFPHAPFRPDEFLDRTKRLARFASWRLRWEPGTRFEYHPSSSMYVIAEIIERRSGATYGDFVRRRISEPLGLRDLWTGLPPAQHAIESFNRSEVRLAGIPGGGGTMTAADLALFYQALLDGGRALAGSELWSPATLAQARRVRTGELLDPVFGKRVHRGLGIVIAGDADRTFRGFGHTNSELAFGHNGAGGQLAWADPVTGLSLGYCTNGHDRNVVRQARRGVGIASRAAACAVES